MNGKCYSCAERDASKPVWDAGADSCRACNAYADGGEYWTGS